MPALSAPDQVKWRTHPQDSDSYLWVDNPPIVFQAQVNHPTAFTYPLTEGIPYDNVTVGSPSDVDLDMLVVFGTTAGADDLGRTRLFGVAAGAVHVPRISQGIVDGAIN